MGADGAAPKSVFSFQVISASTIRKAPGRTEFQRSILSQGANGLSLVHISGEQGWGILSSMSKVNCFTVMTVEQGNVKKGSVVQIPLF